VLESDGCVGLELDGGDVVELRVEPDELVVVADVVGHELAHDGAGLELLAGEQLLLKGGEERLRNGVKPTTRRE
jgi:hypothetical protein